MLPDSTVADTKKAKKKRKSEKGEGKDGAPAKKNKKKAEPSRKKLLVKKKTKKVENDDSDMDLDKELHPISYYIKDREELVHQMFASLKKSKVRSMLPDILKKYKMDEIERLCGEQLQIMSKKRILALVQGKKSDDISSSSTEDLSSDDDAIKVVEKVCLDPPDSTGVSCELLSDDVQQVVPPQVVARDKAPVNKQKLEILELELRARAIKKMLQSQQGEVDSEDEESVATEATIEADIRKHMASEQKKEQSTDSVQSPAGGVGSDGGAATPSLPLPQSKRLIRKRTQSEMEPGEISDYEGESDAPAARNSALADKTISENMEDSGGEKEMSQSEGGTEMSQSEGGTEMSQSEGGREVSQSEGGTEMSQSKGGTEMSQSEGGREVTQSEGGREMSQSEGGREMSQSEGGREMSQSEGGREMSQSEGGREMSQSEGGREMSQSEGGREMSQSEGGREMSQSEGGREMSQSEGGREMSQSEGGREMSQSEGGREMSQSEGGREMSQSEGGRESSKSSVEEESDWEAADVNKELIDVSEEQRSAAPSADGNLEEGEVSCHESAEEEQSSPDNKISSSNHPSSSRDDQDAATNVGQDNFKPRHSPLSQDSSVPTDAVGEVSSTLHEDKELSPKNSPRESSDSDDGRELMAPEPSVTSSDSKFKCTGLNWPVDIDITIDQSDEDLCASDKEKDGEAEPDDRRALTPEITAQRYRPHSFTSSLDLIASELKEEKELVKPSTKVHSSASTVGMKSKKSAKSAKREKSDPKPKLDSKQERRSSKVSEKKEKETKERVKSSSKRSSAGEKDEKVKEKPEADACKSSEQKEYDSQKRKLSSQSTHTSKESEVKNDHSIRYSRSESHGLGESISKARKLSQSKPSVFERLSNHSYETTNLSDRFKNYQSRRSPSPRDYRSNASRYQGQPTRRRESAPTYTSDSDARHYRRSSLEERDQRESRTSDRHHVTALPTNRTHDSKRRCTSLSDKPPVVKTYDLVHTDTRKKIGSEQTFKNNSRKKSPIRFPSPDIAIVDSLKNKAPLLVVISDSD